MNLVVLCRAPAHVALMLALGFPAAGIAAAEKSMERAPTGKFNAWRYGDQNLTWMTGPFVELCTANNVACVKAKIPKSLGKIESVMPGPFIQRARASWIATSKFGSFVCAAFRGRSVVGCVKIEGNALPLQYVNIDYEITAANQTRINVKAKSKLADINRIRQMEKSFRKSFWKAAHLLQGEADYANSSQSSMMSTMSVCDHGLGPPPYDDCTQVQDGNVWMWSCPGVGQRPDPAPEPDPYPEPEPEPDPFPDPDPGC